METRIQQLRRLMISVIGLINDEMEERALMVEQRKFYRSTNNLNASMRDLPEIEKILSEIPDDACGFLLKKEELPIASMLAKCPCDNPADMNYSWCVRCDWKRNFKKEDND